jgi:hypothetical protein
MALVVVIEGTLGPSAEEVAAEHKAHGARGSTPQTTYSIGGDTSTGWHYLTVE